MKQLLIMLHLAVGLLLSGGLSAQSVATEPSLPVKERMEKARAAKMAKRTAPVQPGNARPATTARLERATAADYRTPIHKSEKGPNGEAVHIGDRGGKFYINKNGNKTYLSSNQ